MGKSKQGDAVTFIQNPEVQQQPLRELVRQRGWDYLGCRSANGRRQPPLPLPAGPPRADLGWIELSFGHDHTAVNNSETTLIFHHLRPQSNASRRRPDQETGGPNA